MADGDERSPEPEDVPVLTPLRVKRPKAAAAGLGALKATLAWSSRETGLVRGARTLLQTNQTTGFDCPGCAWPEPRHRSSFEFCENGAKAVTHEATTKRVSPAFFAAHSVAALKEKSDHWLEAQGRLTHPMVLRRGGTHYEPIAWDDAFTLIAQHLRALERPDDAIFYTSGRTSNEAAFLYQLFVRAFGTNNLPDCSNMCHESSGVGLNAVIGVGKGTVTLDDFQKADAIFVIGQNPGTNHPRMLTTLEEAKKRGAKIVSINPLKERALERFSHPQKPLALLGGSTEISDLYLQVRIGGDIALLKGLMKEVLARAAYEEGGPDRAFIDAHTQGFEVFRAALDEVGWEEIEASSGLSRDEIARAADIYCRAERVIACWAMGLTQHKFGVANIQEVVNLLLLRGNLGKPGAGACPVRGHSNVQGDRTMGIWEAPRPAFLDALKARFGFDPPRHHGFAVVDAISAMEEEKGRYVFFAMGGNFASAAPDTPRTAAALAGCRLTVQVSTKLNRSHLEHGEEALILPCLGRTEIDLSPKTKAPRFVTVENSMGVVHASAGRLPPASEHLLSEPDIVARLAYAVLGPGADTRLPDWSTLTDDYDAVRDLIADVVPGFADYNRRVREPGGFVLKNAAREGVYRPIVEGETWEGERARARFTVHDVPPEVLGPGQLMMMTVRSHDQYNTTVYGLDDRYRGVFGERRVILLHPADMEARGLVEGQRVDITSHHDGAERHASGFIALPYDLPRRCAATYFPEANPLVPLEHRADGSKTPASKSVVITLRASAP